MQDQHEIEKSKKGSGRDYSCPTHALWTSDGLIHEGRKNREKLVLELKYRGTGTMD